MRGLRCAAVVLVLAGSAAAEEPAVYELHLPVDLAVTAAAFVGATVPYLLPHAITPRCPCDPREVNRLDRVAIGHHSAAASTASDVTAALAIGVPPVADALRLGLGGALAADVAVFTETLAVNSALVVAAKYSTRRPLPVTYEGDPRYVRAQGGYRSFYSGHTSTVVSALTAGAWTLQFRDGPAVWPWALVGVAGASVGIERVLAGRHFPTDVLAGAAAGFAVGTAVPWLHRRRRGGAVALVPLLDGIAVAGRF